MSYKSSCILTVALKQQTPLIHFQHEQSGATLRASEVKPKLDKFITTLYESKNESIINAWKLGEHDALNYKMRIVADKDSGFSEIPYSIFYANMGAERRMNPLKMIVGNCTVTIICSIPQLMSSIKEHISEFFVVTTFGMMSGKGFGGYLPVDYIPSKQEVAKALNACHKCHSIFYNESSYPVIVSKLSDTYGKRRTPPNIFDNLIKPFHSLMKSGINFNGYARSFLFQYFHEKYDKGQIIFGNDKAYVKSKGIAPVTYKLRSKSLGEHKRGYEQFKYIRALLGTTNKIEYIDEIGTDDKPVKDNNGKIIKTSVSITSTGTIDRFPSPVQYRIIGNTCYVFAIPIPKELFNSEFEFFSDLKPSQSTTPNRIRVPDKADFDINDFLHSFISYINMDGNARKVARFQREKFIEVVSP